MRRLMIVVLVLLLATVAFANIQPQTVALKATLINQNPDPVRPGEYVDLKFRIENNGQMGATGVQVELIEQFPFSLNPGVLAVQTIGSLGGLQKDNEGVVVDYRVRVEPDAVLGKNELVLQVTRDGGSPISYEFDVDIRARDSGVSIVGVQTNPMQLVPGEAGSLEIRVQNPSDLSIRDVQVSLDLSSEELPLAPFQSATTQKVSLLRSNEVSAFTFGLIPFADASAGVYRLPVTIQYFGSQNEIVEIQEIVGLIIGAEPEVSFSVDSTDFYTENSNGRIVVYFINKGLADVRFLDIVLQNTDEYEVISNKETYIGVVNSDDFETSEFTILRKSESSDFDISLNYQYRDANNNLYEGTATIPVTLYSSKLNGEGRSRFGLIFVLVLLAGAIGYWYYRKRKK